MLERWDLQRWEFFCCVRTSRWTEERHQRWPYWEKTGSVFIWHPKHHRETHPWGHTSGLTGFSMWAAVPLYHIRNYICSDREKCLWDELFCCCNAQGCCYPEPRPFSSQSCTQWNLIPLAQSKFCISRAALGLGGRTCPEICSDGLLHVGEGSSGLLIVRCFGSLSHTCALFSPSWWQLKSRLALQDVDSQ